MQKSDLIFTQSIAESFSKYCLENGIIKPIFICDTNTRQHCMPLLDLSQVQCIEVPAGENYKHLITCTNILDQLLEYQTDRSTCIINVGGGVISDIGGFAASIYRRGIPFINIPTTLLSMVDASIGGKTGIDYRHLKNYIGTFLNPKAIFISDQFLETLDELEINSAWSEIIKTAVMTDADLYSKIVNNNPLFEIIKTCALRKNEITLADFKDENTRQLLNFGHTIGHAYESYRLSIEDPIRHGDSVALGMIIELDIAVKLEILTAENASIIKTLIIEKTGIQPIHSDAYNKLFSFLSSDKKNMDESIVFSLPERIGAGRYGIKVTLEALKNWKNQGFI